MILIARPTTLAEIEPLRDIYRLEMACQIIHDSIHVRAGWTKEYLLLSGDIPVGYGSVAIAGPWTDHPTLYEFFLVPPFRGRTFDAFLTLVHTCGAERIETQSNDPLLTNMLHTFCTNVESEAILFEDHTTTDLRQPGVVFRQKEPGDADGLARNKLDGDAQWLLERAGEIVGTGGILYHYNRPYGDIYMAVAEAHRRQGLGSFLVQELKRVCYAGGSVPAARCNVKNAASRRTLQRAGFVPCGHIITGTIPDQVARGK